MPVIQIMKCGFWSLSLIYQFPIKHIKGNIFFNEFSHFNVTSAVEKMGVFFFQFQRKT